VAVGDAATAAGYSLVPDTGEEGKVKWGAREINRTRDYTALLKALIPLNKATFRSSAGISSGTAEPAGGMDGDIYFKILP
jgi:hypothetical protein